MLTDNFCSYVWIYTTFVILKIINHYQYVSLLINEGDEHVNV